MELNLNTTNENKISNLSEELKKFLENHKEGDTFTVDRIENDVAICENRRTGLIINIHTSKLPTNIKENDIIKYTNGNYSIDKNETQLKKESIKNKFDALRKK